MALKTLEQLEEQESVLWAQLKELEAPYQAKSLEWCQVKREIDRLKLKAELLKEMETNEK